MLSEARNGEENGEGDHDAGKDGENAVRWRLRFWARVVIGRRHCEAVGPWKRVDSARKRPKPVVCTHVRWFLRVVACIYILLFLRVFIAFSLVKHLKDAREAAFRHGRACGGLFR